MSRLLRGEHAPTIVADAVLCVTVQWRVPS
jgi:hypothetical protein